MVSSYWIAEQRVNEFTQECGFSDHTIGRTCTGSDLAGKATLHPFIDRDSMVVNAEYVTMDTGTGCVHIAPGHGLDDYLTGLEHDLEIYCPLDDGGKYLDDGQIPKELVGLSVLEKAMAPRQTMQFWKFLHHQEHYWLINNTTINILIVGGVNHR